MSAIIVYGHPVSQPTRSVLWALKLKSTPFEFKMVDFIKGDNLLPEYLADFPTGAVPALRHGDLMLVESGAILQYLANANGWADLYPVDPKQRALVDMWLHFNHTGSRDACTLKIFRPHVFNALGGKHRSVAAETIASESVQGAWKEVLRIMTALGFKKSGGPYLTGATPTLADIAVHSEVVQIVHLPGMGAAAFEGYPEVQKWLELMKTLPHYDEVHAPMHGALAMVEGKYAAVDAAAAAK